MNAKWEIIFWDVGQGDATTIKLPDGSFILVDAGPSANCNNPLPGWFDSIKNPPVKIAVVTHSHADHFSGLIPLCQNKKQAIEKIVLLKDAKYIANKKLAKALALRCKTGTKLEAVDSARILYEDDSLRLRIAYPQDLSSFATLPNNVNETCMILILERVEKPNAPLIIFGGDAPLEEVKLVCHKMPPVIMTGPHHGGPEGHKETEEEEYYRIFKKEFSPSSIFISVARSNSYSLPDVKYVCGAARAGICICCSQLSKDCDENRSQDVFEGSAFIGLAKPPKSVQCRGSMRVYVSADGLRFDENQEDFKSAVSSKIPNAKCIP